LDVSSSEKAREQRAQLTSTHSEPQGKVEYYKQPCWLHNVGLTPFPMKSKVKTNNPKESDIEIAQCELDSGGKLVGLCKTNKPLNGYS